MLFAQVGKVEQFLDAGVDVESVSARKQETALHLAAAGGFTDVAKVLRDATRSDTSKYHYQHVYRFRPGL